MPPPDDEAQAPTERRSVVVPAPMTAMEALPDPVAGIEVDELNEDQAATLELGRSIGPWQVLRVLGRGGMGAVYLAERRLADFDQRAALKLIKLGMDSAEILRRFLAERRILARLAHPNIARLLDGGMDERGRPYFAMEWIDGLPLIEYADAQQLGVAARIRLFLKLCDAVAHAHRQLVVHRDIKPGNVLVDAHGEPKLLDFGIAKLLEETSDGDTSATGPRFFTRAYAAPEQVRGEPVSTSTDVYALGAVLFELLSGMALHQCQTTRADTRRMLVEARRLSGESGPRSIAPRELAGDVGVVIGMAVRDEATRRYPSVESFAADLRAVLEGRPVQARADSVRYRIGKFLRRHALAVSAGAAVLLAIILGAMIALWQARIAQQEALRAEQVSRFLGSVFESARIEEGESDITARALLERGAERIERELKGQPRVQARLLDTLGSAYHSLGDYARSIDLLQAALARLDADSPDRISVLRHLAQAELASAALNEALQHLDQAEDLRRRHRPADEVERARLLGVRKSVLGVRGDIAEARQLAQQVYDTLKQALGADAEESLLAWNDLGNWTAAVGEHEQAVAIFEAVLAARRRVSGADHPEVAGSLHNLQLSLVALQRLDEARVIAEQALAQRRRTLPATHRDLARSLGGLAAIESRQGRLDEATRLRDEAIAILRAQPRTDVLLLANEQVNAAVDEFTLGRYASAESRLREALGWMQERLADEDPRVLSAQSYLGLLQSVRGELSNAVATLEAVERRYAALAPAEVGRRVANLRYLARALRWQGLPGLAQARAEQAHSLAQDAAVSVVERHRVLSERAAVALDAGELAAARTALSELPEGVGAIDRAQASLLQARLLAAAGDAAAAADLAARAAQTLIEGRGAQHPDALEAQAWARYMAWRAAPAATRRADFEIARDALRGARPWLPALREWQ